MTRITWAIDLQQNIFSKIATKWPLFPQVASCDNCVIVIIVIVMAGRSPCHHLDGGQNTDGGQRARTLARPSHRRDGDRRTEILQECRYIDNVAQLLDV